MSADGNPRRHRVAQEIRDLLAEMLEREVKDPRIHAAGVVSLSHVELNRDMSSARVYVSFLASDDRVIDRAMAGFESAAGYLRGPLARRMRLRRAPALRFVRDTSIEFGHRLADIVRDDDARSVPERAAPEVEVQTPGGPGDRAQQSSPPGDAVEPGPGAVGGGDD